MTRKRALGRQPKDDSHKHSPTNMHRTVDLESEVESSFPPNSQSRHGSPGKKSFYRHPSVLKSNCVHRGRKLLRPMLNGGLLKMISIGAILLSLVSLTLPKMIFDVARYLTMSRPTVLYGSPTDWEDVAGCLSRMHRREVRDHFEMDSSSPDYHLYSQLPLNADVEWNWSRFSSSHSTSESKDGVNGGPAFANHTEPRGRLLIAQYSGKGSYQQLLDEVEPINRAYAKRWGHDYVTLVGTGLKFPGLIYDSSQEKSGSIREQQRYCRYYYHNASTSSTSSSSDQPSESSSSFYNYEAQSTFNKIPLLFRAMEESPSKYDQVLILDSDTMIVDFDYDITSLLLSSESINPNDDYGEESESVSVDDNSLDGTESMIDDDLSYFLVAYRVWKFEWLSTWDVNAGITLWNLRHPSTRIVAEDWLKMSLSDPKQILLKNDDQYYLQRALQKHSSNSNSLGTSFFDGKALRNWWRDHSFLPALIDYYYDNSSVESDPELAVNAISRRYDDLDKGGSGIKAIREEFEYYDATVIKHFKRDTASWSRTGLDQRLLRIREVKSEICQQWPNDCPS